MGRVLTLGEGCSVAEALHETGEALRQGGVAVFPTDTVYGIGLLVSANPKGPEPLFRIKQRDHAKKIPLLLPSAQALDAYADGLSEQALALARAFWPGGLTLVVRAGRKVPAAYRNHDGTVALRVPGPSFALDLVSSLGEAMAVTSANTSGLPAPAEGAQVEERIARQVDMVVNGGATCWGESSTIVDCTSVTPQIKRQGAVSCEAIVSVLQSLE